MKKHLFIYLAIAALTMTACNKAKETEPEGFGLKKVSIAASFEQPVSDSKSTITDAGEFTWTDGDAISVYTNAGAFNGTPLNLASGAGQSSGMFTGTLTVGTKISTVTVFPAYMQPALSGTTLTLNLPSTIQWEQGKVNNIMIGKGFEDNVSPAVAFKNVGGIIKLSLNNVPAGANKMVFSTGKKITGGFTCDIADDEPFIETTDGTDELTFNFEQLTEPQDMVFYIPVPVGTYPYLGFDIKNDNTSLWDFQGTSSNTITRGKLLIMPPLTCVSVNGGGENGSLIVNTAANYSGNVYLPKTSSNVIVKLAETNGQIDIVYATGATDEEKPANVYIQKYDAGTISTLNVNLPDSHVELEGTGTIENVSVHTNLNTFVIGKDVIVGEATVTGGSLVLEGEVTGDLIIEQNNEPLPGEQKPEVFISAGASVGGNLVCNDEDYNVNLLGEENKPATVASLVMQAGNAQVGEHSAVGTIEANNEGTQVIVDNGATVESATGDGQAGVIIASEVTKADGSSPVEVQGQGVIQELEIETIFRTGGSLVMDGNIVLERALVAEEDTDITLDLNGHVLSYEGSAPQLSTGFVIIKRGAALTINDSSRASSTKIGTGLIEAGANAYAALQVTMKGDNPEKTAVLNINNTNISGDYYAITGNGTRDNTEITVSYCTLTGNHEQDNLGIYHPQQGTLTIKGAATTITGYSSGIEMRAGTLTVNAGTITATATQFSEAPNGSGTTIVGSAIAVSQHKTNKALSVTLKGGTYNGLYSLYEKDLQNSNPGEGIALSVTAGTYNGSVYSQNCTKFLSAGAYYAEKPQDAYVADNKKAYEKTSGNITYWSIQNYVVENITSLAGSLQSSGEYYLTLDADLSGNGYTYSTFADSKYVFYLNGHNISSNRSGDFPTFLVRANGKLILNGNGTVTNNNNNSPVIWTSSNTAEATINGGTYDSKGSSEVIYCEKGLIVINGGVFKCDSDDKRYVLNCKDANYNSGSARIIVRGGTFWDFNPADCLAEGQGTSFVDTGYGVVQDEQSQPGHILYTVIPIK